MSTIKPLQPPADVPRKVPAPLYAALDAIGFVGCVVDDDNLSVDYKAHIDFATKAKRVDKPTSARHDPVSR